MPGMETSPAALALGLDAGRRLLLDIPLALVLAVGVWWRQGAVIGADITEIGAVVPRRATAAAAMWPLSVARHDALSQLGLLRQMRASSAVLAVRRKEV